MIPTMFQQGQVFELTTRGGAGEPLWAYRVRAENSISCFRVVGS
jgi:hypothetical protein